MLLRNTHYPQDIAQAVQQWQAGGLVVFPTETVYGLGADARNSQAVAQIYALKDRPRFNPLIVHVASVGAAQRYVEWNDHAERLSHLWPGPLTLVLPHKGEICDLARAGGHTVGVRIPRHPLALAFLEAFDGPIAAPSANKSGRISPTTAEHARVEFGDSVPILDGGACEVGLESTVVDCTGERPRILRAGGITREMLGDGVSDAQEEQSGALRSPGQLESHYAPSKPLRLNANSVEAGEGLLAFGPDAPRADYSVNLSLRGDVADAATNLFAALRTLDAMPISAIAAMPIPNRGIGEAIIDRLTRAAAPR